MVALQGLANGNGPWHVNILEKRNQWTPAWPHQPGHTSLATPVLPLQASHQRPATRGSHQRPATRASAHVAEEVELLEHTGGLLQDRGQVVGTSCPQRFLVQVQNLIASHTHSARPSPVTYPLTAPPQSHLCTLRSLCLGVSMVFHLPCTHSCHSASHPPPPPHPVSS